MLPKEATPTRPSRTDVILAVVVASICFYASFVCFFEHGDKWTAMSALATGIATIAIPIFNYMHRREMIKLIKFNNRCELRAKEFEARAYQLIAHYYQAGEQPVFKRE